MRVLHINTSDLYGGSEQFSYDFINTNPHDCCLLVGVKQSNSEKVYEFPIVFIDKVFHFFDKVLYKIGIRKRFKQIFSISDQYNFTYKKLKKLKVYCDADVIHLHNIHGGYFDMEALLDISADKPIVWTLHDMWSITGGEAHTFNNDNYKFGIGKTEYTDIYPLNNALVDRRQYFLEKKKMIYDKIANKIVLVPASFWLEKCVKQAFVFNSKMRVETIHYGINLDIFRNKFQRNWSTPRVLIFNSKSPFKGVDAFWNIAEKIIGSFELIVVGEKPTINIPFAHHGFVKERNILADLYNNVDILIFPSNADTFPFTILEAMSCGVCVIGCEVCGITEQLANGNGILFSTKEELLEKINSALLDILHIRSIGAQASSNAQNHYNIKSMHEKYSRIYSSLV